MNIQFDDVFLSGKYNLKLRCRENEKYDSSRSRTRKLKYTLYGFIDTRAYRVKSFFFLFIYLFLYSCRSQPYRAVEREK